MDKYLQEYVVDRGWGGPVDTRSPWQILVVYDRLTIDRTTDTTQVLQHADLFILNTKSKSLLFQKTVTGEGLSDATILRDLARQAAAEYAEFLPRPAFPPPPPGGPKSKPPFGFPTKFFGRPGPPPGPPPR